MSNVVIVESPAKAKTINKYLGSDYKVLASYGHIRDLPSKDGSVRPDDDFDMDWEIDPKANKRIKDITNALKGADHLYLATDPDREGEAIAWHVQEVLKEKKLLDNIDVKRVVFNEITAKAVREAFTHPRELDHELIDAYLARRALDYLVGFNLSPVLWRKLPGSRSAGRVQSVALRLICERETEIEAFKPDEYWSIEVTLETPKGEPFTAQLTQLEGEKLKKLSIANQEQADNAVALIRAANYKAAEVERKQVRRNPPPPFITSTLQQEAARKLYFNARRTMQVAQKLYEGVDIGGETVGLITYMRTDGVTLAQEAITGAREVISKEFGAEYVPPEPRVFKSKAKNAQEAHEAVRPTDLARRPDDVAKYLDQEQYKLYELIWKRTVACQMASAVLDQVGINIPADDGKTVLRATGSVVTFDGFFKVYQEGQDDTDQNDDKDKGDSKDRILPAINENDPLSQKDIKPEQHFTQPPPRYSEASLVKKLEELGIGRPSTYASIISVLQDRNYVRIEKRRFIPGDRGRLVTAFLSSFFTRYVEYNFTAELENELDEITEGKVNWKKVLKDFWSAFSSAVGETKDLRIREVLDTLDELLGPHFFPESSNGKDPRACGACDDGRLNLKLGKFGAFIGCSNYPDCRFTRPLEVVDGEGDGVGSLPKNLGKDPETELDITLRKGPYGFYLQRGEPIGEGDDQVKPKRTALPKTYAPSDVDLELALALLSLPRRLGHHPETNKVIAAGIGRFGPYIRHDQNYVSLKGDDDVLTIGLNRAVTLIADAPKKEPPKEVAKHPDDGKPITIRTGRYGPYLQHGTLRAALPKDKSEDDITLEIALELLAAKAKKSPQKKTKKKAAKKKATKKKATKKKTAKKKTAKKKAKSDTKTEDSEDTASPETVVSD
ncbi:MAG: type I DNA topoisomerase [Rhodospirillaceae bacterium]|jgi:DNA topoisomerase-1